MRPSAADIAGTIDHAILKPELTRDDVDAAIDVAVRYRVVSVCVRPSDVAQAASRLGGTGVAVGTVIGFPHGTTSTAAKRAEAVQAIEDGAAELDMVLNVGRLRSGLTDDVEDDVRGVVGVAGGRVVKVILETALLSDDEVVAGARAAERAGASFVKTSTGFAGGGATDHHVALMRRTVSSSVQVKASGGIRDLDTALRYLAAGVTRLGTSATATILDDATARATGSTATPRMDASSY